MILRYFWYIKRIFGNYYQYGDDYRFNITYSDNFCHSIHRSIFFTAQSAYATCIERFDYHSRGIYCQNIIFQVTQ